MSIQRSPPGPGWFLPLLLAVTVGACGTSTEPVAAPTASSRLTAHGAASFRAIDLGFGPGISSFAFAINARGQIVGSITFPSGNDRAVLWQDGETTELPLLPGDNLADAQAINSKGQIAGISEFLEEHPTFVISRIHAVVWQGGRVEPLPNLPGGQNDLAHAINDGGQVAGECELPPPQGGAATPVHACLWDHGAVKDLGTLGGTVARAAGINNRGEVVGSSTIADGAFHAFLWRSGQMVDLGTLGGNNSFAAGINAQGEIVGSAETPSGVHHAVHWIGGQIADLEGTGDGFSSASDINERGEIVGTITSASGFDRRAILWDHGSIVSIEPGKGGGAGGINNRGQIVGGHDVPPPPPFGEATGAVLWERVHTP